MNNLHPNERQLQRLLNKACTELEYKRIQQHIRSCDGCRTRLHTYLNLEELLNKMDVLAPPPGLEDRVMLRIGKQSIEPHDELSLLSRHARKPEPAASRSRLWRPELFNGLIATAATYVFVSSGIMQKIFSIHADDWETGVESIGNTVHQIISLYLTS